MNNMDIRRMTCLVVKKGNEFVVCRQAGTGIIKFTTSPWEAWSTRIRANARSVAEKIDGEVFLFNPIVGQIRKMTL